MRRVETIVTITCDCCKKVIKEEDVKYKDNGYDERGRNARYAYLDIEDILKHTKNIGIVICKKCFERALEINSEYIEKMSQIIKG